MRHECQVMINCLFKYYLSKKSMHEMLTTPLHHEWLNWLLKGNDNAHDEHVK